MQNLIMKIKQEKIYSLLNTPIIIAIINFKSLIDIINGFFKTINTGKIMIQINWFDFFIQIFVSILLWIFIRKYFKLKDDTELYFYVFKTILDAKTKRLFVKDYSNVNFYPKPNEPVEKYLERHPEYGLYYNNLLEEKEIVKNQLMIVLKEKKISELDEILELMYPELINYKR